MVVILKENVTRRMVKPLSDTRWESHIDGVKVLRCHLQELHCALEGLVDQSVGKGDGNDSLARRLDDEQRRPEAHKGWKLAKRS